MSLQIRDFNDYVATLSPAVYLALGLGDIVRRDGNVNPVIRPDVNGTPQWEHRDGSYVLTPRSGGSLELDTGDISETDVTAFTLFMAGVFDSAVDLGDDYSIAEKTNRWHLRLFDNAGADTIRFTDSTPANHDIPFNVVGAKTLAVTAQTGDDVAVFRNGTLVGDDAGVTLSATAEDLFVLNNDANGDEMRGGLSLFLFVPSVLNGEQISDLSRTWEAIG